MDRRRRIVLMLGAGLAVAVIAMLYVTLGLVDTLGVLAVTAVLIGLYQLRASARRALMGDRHSLPQSGRRGETKVETAGA